MENYSNIFDTHTHYDDEKFDADRREILENLEAKGVVNIVNAACDIASCKSGIALANEYPFIYCAVGIHPHAANEYSEQFKETLITMSKNDKVLAIGEIGLDYHYDFAPRDIQKYVFEAQLALANELNLPVIIHDREAHQDTMELLQKYKPKGILHCFSGSAEMAKEIVKLGMYIAFGGAVTFKNANKLLDAACAVPIDRLLVETDCPYMTPEPFRGKRCDSSLIPLTANRLAELKCIDTQKLLNITCENAKCVYGLPF